jgi:hypothetical protein
MTSRTSSVSVVFVGPSLTSDQVRLLLPDAVVLPPVAQGDFASALERYQPDTVVVIDGEFGQNLSVWHKEIMLGLSRGVRVIGASSMGASMDSRSKAGRPVSVRDDAFRNCSPAGLASTKRPSASIRKAGSGSEAQITPGTG